jgi:predicted MFS family arabinose efflux permease
MIAVLRQRNFALLWAGGLISTLGDWLLFIALPFYIYERTGSTLATGAMFIAETLPTLLLGSLGGVFADRWDRRRTMIAADLLRAVLLLLLLAARSPEWLWAIYLVVFIQSAIGQFFNPAKGALLPQLVDEHSLMPANALNTIGVEITRLIGAPLGGGLTAQFGLASVVLLDSASFVLSALLIALIAAPAAARPSDQSAPAGHERRASVARDLADGLALVWRERWLGGLFLGVSLIMLGQGITNVLLVPFINQVLHGDAQTFGWVVTAQGIGGLAGGLLVGQIGRLLAPARLMALSAWLLGVIVLVIVNVPLLALVLALIALVGLPVVAFIVTESTLIQGGVADAYRGRVLGSYGVILALILLFGMGAGSALGDWAGPVALFDLVGGLYILAGVVVLIMLGQHGAPAGPSAVLAE